MIPTSRAGLQRYRTRPPGRQSRAASRGEEGDEDGQPVRAAPSATTRLAARIAPRRRSSVPSSTFPSSPVGVDVVAWNTSGMATRPTPRKIGRLSEIAQVAVRHGFGASSRAQADRPAAVDARVEPSLEAGVGSERGLHLREMLDELGPTFVKFGQLLSTARRRPTGHRRRASCATGRRPSFPFAQARAAVQAEARSDTRAGVPPLRGDADRRRDRAGTPGDAPERRRGRREGAATQRAGSDRVRPRAPLPGRA